MVDEKRFVPGLEQDQVSRALLVWLNQYQEKPINHIEFEFLGKDGGMALSSITAAYKTTEYITGNYDAQYQFAIIYRVMPSTSGERLTAAESLDTLGRWAEARTDLPVLGTNMTAMLIERNSTASMIRRFDDGSEDYQLLMNLIYEVKNNG